MIFACVWLIGLADLAEFEKPAAVVGGLVALLGFPFVIAQLFIAQAQRREAIRLSTTQALLAFDAVLATHQEVARNLRPRGIWWGKAGEQHPDLDELGLVEPYMGLFERIFISYQIGQVDANMIDRLYGYRLANIWANRRIVDDKLQNGFLKEYWDRLIALTYVVEAQRGQVFPLHTDTYFPEELFDPGEASRIRLERTGKKPG